MLTTIEGTYEDGKVELRETPPHIDHARVIVTFLPDAAPSSEPEQPVDESVDVARAQAFARLADAVARGENDVSPAERWRLFRQWAELGPASPDVADAAFDRGEIYK